MGQGLARLEHTRTEASQTPHESTDWPRICQPGTRILADAPSCRAEHWPRSRPRQEGADPAPRWPARPTTPGPTALRLPGRARSTTRMATLWPVTIGCRPYAIASTSTAPAVTTRQHHDDVTVAGSPNPWRPEERTPGIRERCVREMIMCSFGGCRSCFRCRREPRAAGRGGMPDDLRPAGPTTDLTATVRPDQACARPVDGVDARRHDHGSYSRRIRYHRTGRAGMVAVAEPPQLITACLPAGHRV